MKKTFKLISSDENNFDPTYWSDMDPNSDELDAQMREFEQTEEYQDQRREFEESFYQEMKEEEETRCFFSKFIRPFSQSSSNSQTTSNTNLLIPPLVNHSEDLYSEPNGNFVRFSFCDESPTAEITTSLSQCKQNSISHKPSADNSSPVANFTAKNTDGKPTPYDVAQELLSREILRTVGNGIYLYDGKIYRLLTKEQLSRFIMSRCRAAIQYIGDASFIDRIYNVIFAEPNIVRAESDQSPDIIVFKNGVLNTVTWEFTAHSPSVFTTSMVDACYYVGAYSHCPNFDSFVETITGGDSILATRIWQSIGYLISQDTRGKCFFVLQGVSDSGKSVLGNFIRNCFDSEAVTSLDINSFSNNFALADLVGKRLCVDLDLPEGVLNNKAVSLLKKMTGGDALSSDVKYMPRITFINTAKLLFATNHAVVTSVNDPAFARRMVVIPFMRAIPREHQNPNLVYLLGLERDAVIAKSLTYYEQLRRNHYIFSGEFTTNEACAPTENTLDLNTCVAGFIAQFCCVENGCWTPTRDLFSAFSNMYPGLCTVNVFSASLEKICSQSYPGVEKKRQRYHGEKNPIYGYLGLKLITSSGKDFNIGGQEIGK